MTAVRCYFSPQSGYAYLGHARLCRIAAETGATILWRPVDIGTVFAESGTVPPPKQSAVRLAYRRADMARFAAALGLPLNPTPPFWPAATGLAQRLIVAAEAEEHDPAALIGAILAAVWARDLDIGDPATLVRLATEEGLDGEALVRLADTPEIAASAAAHTAEAVAAGVFGSPSYIVGDELFFGQDRLDFVEAALRDAAGLEL